MNLRLIKDKATRDNAVIEFLRSDSQLSPCIDLLDLVNPYSYKLRFTWDDTHVMLYTSTLKVYDESDPEGTFVFNTLDELKNYLLPVENSDD